MTKRNPSHKSWRLAAVGIVLVSLCLTSMTPAHAADMLSIVSLTSFDSGSYPAGLVYGPDQATWFTLSGTGEISQFSGGSSTIHALPDLTSRPLDITIGADQALWFSEETGNQIGRLTSAGELTEFPLGEGKRSPIAITLGQDLALWFTEFDGNRIGRITTSGDLTEFDLPHADSKPQGIVSAADGNLWFTEWNSYRIGEITLQGEIREFDIPNPPARPVDLLYGPDGNLWVIFNTGKTVVRFNLQSHTFDRYLLSTQSSSLTDLTIGPDNHIWFVGTQTSGNFELVDGIPANLQEELLTSPVYTYRGRSQIITGPDNDLIMTAANSSTVYQSSLTGDPALRDLQLFITYQPPLLLSAGKFNIDTQIINWTNTDATNLEIELTLDEDIHFVSTDLPGGVCVDHGITVNCTLPSLGAGASLPVSFVMTTDRIHTDVVDRTLAFEVSSSEGDYQPANNRVVIYTRIQRSIDYFNDFSQGADEYWSDQTTSTPVAGLDVLGLFDNEQLTFNYGVLPPHDRAWLCFDLYVMGLWDGSQYLDADDTTIIGPDLWANYIDDNRLLLTTFSNQARYMQAFPSNYPDQIFPFQSKSYEVGEFDGDLTVKDARYHFCYRLEHSNLSLKVFFMGLNLNGLDQEKWALDNVRMKIYYDASLDWIYLPSVIH